MLIHDFLQLTLTFAEVRDIVARDAHGAIDDCIAGAYRDGEDRSATMRSTPDSPVRAPRVWADLGSTYARGDGFILPITWWAPGAIYLFPRLDGDLEVMPVGDAATQLTLMGTYDAPAVGPGPRIDTLLLHRLTEGTVRSFLKRMGLFMQATLAAEAVL